MKRTIPDPQKYKIKNESFSQIGGKFGKQSKNTMIGQVASKHSKENLPGPATYFKRPATAVTKTTQPKVGEREHYLNEVFYSANQAPGVGQYNLRSSMNQQGAIIKKQHK